MLTHAWRTPELKRAFDNASLVIADSIGVVWAARFLKQKSPALYPGIDLMMDCMRFAAEQAYPIFLLGSRQDTVKKTAVLLKKIYPNILITGTHHGYFSADEEDDIYSMIRRAKPVFVFVGLDTPRQEVWISENLNRINAPVVIGIGGSFDIISGRLRRSPRWMRSIGLEWLFRTIQQPWRIVRLRNLIFFAILIVLQRFKPDSQSSF